MTIEIIKRVYSRAYVKKMESMRIGYNEERDLCGDTPLCEPWVQDPAFICDLRDLATKADEDGDDWEDVVEQEAVGDAVTDRKEPITPRQIRENEREQRIDAERM